MPLPLFYSLFFLLLSIIMIPAIVNATEDPPSVDNPVLDQVSIECVSCHNDSNKDHAGLCQIAHGSFCSDHNFSSPYTELAARNKELRPKVSLPAEMVLYKDRITCVSCHSGEPHDGQPTTIDNRSSALCQACHLK